MIKHHVGEEEKRPEGLLAQAKAVGLGMDTLAERLMACKDGRRDVDRHLPPPTHNYGHILVQDKPLASRVG
jgi:hypothetical protein